MAAYEDLAPIMSDIELKLKIEIAVTIAAKDINDLASSTDSQKSWAAQALADPLAEVNRFLAAIIAENNTASVAAITGAADSLIQTNVDNFV